MLGVHVDDVNLMSVHCVDRVKIRVGARHIVSETTSYRPVANDKGPVARMENDHQVTSFLGKATLIQVNACREKTS
jgi:hypothetical protein